MALLVNLGLLAVLVVVTIVSWRLWGDGRIRQWEELAALPEASLHYPGSVQIGAAGRDYQVSILARVDAFYFQSLGVDASIDEVRDFYARELSPRGWEPSCGYEPGCVGGGGWRKGQLFYSITVDPTAISTGYRTVYALRIHASPLPPTPTAGH